jgi:DNA-binding response OmpR family regulator
MMNQQAGRGVLIVEDEHELRVLFAALLEMEGFRVYQARDGQQGLDMLLAHTGEIDLMITDLNLPQMRGFELISRARALSPGIRILGTSGLDGAEVRTMVQNAGADGFLPKPFQPLAALEAIKSILQKE